MVEKLQAQGQTPAILLVYGIPLRVGKAPLTKPEKSSGSLAVAKVKEYQAQAVPLIHKLTRLTGVVTEPPRLTSPRRIFSKSPGIPDSRSEISRPETGHPGGRGDPGRD